MQWPCRTPRHPSAKPYQYPGDLPTLVDVTSGNLSRKTFLPDEAAVRHARPSDRPTSPCLSMIESSGSIVDGVVDRVTSECLYGWAFVRGSETPLVMELLVNREIVATATSEKLRPAVKAAGRYPTGRCGFELRIPPSANLRPRDHLHVRARDASGELRRSQYTVVAAGDGSLGFEPVPDRLKAAGQEEPDDVEIPVFPKAPPRRPWAIVKTTLFALFLREVGLRYGASRFGYLWAIAQPLLMLLILTQARALLAGGDTDLYGVSGAYFFLIGVVPYFMFQHAYHQAMGAIASGRGVLNYREVRPLDLVLVRCGIEFIIMFLVMILTVLGFWWFDVLAEFDDPLSMFACAVLLFFLALGLGLIAEVAIMRNDDSRKIFGLIERPLFFISGVFFAVEAVPEPMRGWLMWNPLLHAIDLGRGAMLSGYESPCSWVYLCLWSFGLLFVGLAMYQRHLHRLVTA